MKDHRLHNSMYIQFQKGKAIATESISVFTWACRGVGVRGMEVQGWQCTTKGLKENSENKGVILKHDCEDGSTTP